MQLCITMQLRAFTPLLHIGHSLWLWWSVGGFPMDTECKLSLPVCSKHIRSTLSSVVEWGAVDCNLIETCRLNDDDQKSTALEDNWTIIVMHCWDVLYFGVSTSLIQTLGTNKRVPVGSIDFLRLWVSTTPQVSGRFCRKILYASSQICRFLSHVVGTYMMTKRASLDELINLFFIQSVLHSGKVTFVLGKMSCLAFMIQSSEMPVMRECLIESIVDVEYRLIHLHGIQW